MSITVKGRGTCICIVVHSTQNNTKQLRDYVSNFAFHVMITAQLATFNLLTLMRYIDKERIYRQGRNRFRKTLLKI